MTYELGKYTEELKEAHRNGEHVEKEDVNCPICNYREIPEGFSSIAEYNDALMKGTVALQAFVDAHNRGEHKDNPTIECIECCQIDD